MENIVEKCEGLKARGNEELKENKFDKAIESYSQAIKLASEEKDGGFPKQKLSVYFANRAQAHIKNQNYGLGLVDAEKSVELNPTYEKAFLRLAFLNELLQHYKESYAAYKKV